MAVHVGKNSPRKYWAIFDPESFQVVRGSLKMCAEIFKPCAGVFKCAREFSNCARKFSSVRGNSQTAQKHFIMKKSVRGFNFECAEILPAFARKYCTVRGKTQN